jgi:hypothetical protein
MTNMTYERIIYLWDGKKSKKSKEGSGEENHFDNGGRLM